MGVRGPQPSPNARRNGAKVYISPAHAERLDKIRESQSRADWLEQTIDKHWEKRTMQVIENAQGWYVENQHGSGSGRSDGGGFAFLAKGETLRGSETLHYDGPYASKAEAEAEANRSNDYYDGSDYS